MAKRNDEQYDIEAHVKGGIYFIIGVSLGALASFGVFSLMYKGLTYIF